MYDLQRFIDAQRYAYEFALAEMEAGRKTSHWIWYIFPQIKGLGHSYNANYYGLSGLDEAREYLDHPVLGQRLREITRAVLAHAEKDIYDIMGARVDALKFRSSMTLFDMVSPNDVFARALDAFFSGVRDMRTLELISGTGPGKY